MILRTAAALALCSLLPLSLAGQDPPLPVVGPDSARASVTHVVEEGETLAALARAYLGGAHEWERIYEANRDVISDPDRILPGMRLVIPGGGVPAAGTPDDPGVEVIRGRPDEPPARVTGVQVEEPPEAREPTARDTTELPELGPSEVDRRRLLQSRPFTPSGVPMHEGPRTVFWGNLSRTAEGPVTPTVHLQD
ncbi:MAG: LysM peptidoglycan-binding domain-containing protein, partial [Acidobacteriota bacterium]